MAKPYVKLLLVDDHQLIRMGLRTLFQTVPHFTVVGEAGTAHEAIAEAGRCAPDVVLMDVRLPDGSGVEACREIRSQHPEIRVVMLTSFADEDAVVASILAGAAGYLLKETAPDRVIEAVETVAGGRSLLDPQVTPAVLDWIRRLDAQPADDPLAVLSEQERKVLPLIAEGKTNREIADLFYLSEYTIKSHVSSILQKLNLSRRAEAAAYIARLQEHGST